MKRLMSIAAIALFVAGSSALACDTCAPCNAKKAEKKASSCPAGKKCEKKVEKKCAEGCKKESCAPKAKKCGEGCKKECCAPKAE